MYFMPFLSLQITENIQRHLTLLNSTNNHKLHFIAVLLSVQKALQIDWYKFFLIDQCGGSANFRQFFLSTDGAHELHVLQS